MKKVAVIGVGIMGNGIASNFLNNGYEVIVWNRTQSKLKSLIAKGAKAANSPKDATIQADIIFEITADDESSRSVWLGKDGILTGANSKKILITCATLSTSWIDELINICKIQKLTFFDVPMTGGRKGAEEGKLILLVGGDAKKLEGIKIDLQAISGQILYFGKAGSGARFKLLLNMLQAMHVIALGEVLELSKKAGLNIKTVGDALAERPGGITTQIAWRDYQTAPDPINFSVDWITKDLRYAKQLANNKSNTPLLDLVLEKYQKAVKQKMGQKDWTAVNKLT